jgi:hypothetical protein
VAFAQNLQAGRHQNEGDEKEQAICAYLRESGIQKGVGGKGISAKIAELEDGGWPGQLAPGTIV